MTNPSDSRPHDGVERDGGLRTLRPPAGFQPVRSWVLDAPTQLHGLRAGLQQEVETRSGAHVDVEGVARDLVLVASELATNAIRHGRPPTIVELLQHETRFLLTVADHDLTSEPRLAGSRPVGEGGFGLQIARLLSIDVGWYRTETLKVVWAEIGS